MLLANSYVSYLREVSFPTRVTEQEGQADFLWLFELYLSHFH